MISLEYIIIISVFVIYYIAVIVKEKKIMRDPKIIIGKFLSVILLYAGISLIYFALTGNPFLGATPESYNVYIFIIGFVAILWTIPDLLEEFKFFRDFGKNNVRRARKK
ncbi:hypothetical protein KAS08_03725 [Candidatus Pacearchaeota archaeon]|nr:hypothetical protein [Candidatus Pacearchaeota archaeon]